MTRVVESFDNAFVFERGKPQTTIVNALLTDERKSVLGVTGRRS